MTQTFSMWLGDVIALWYQQDNQRLGQLFTDELYKKSPLLANALTTFKHDPFYHNEIHPDILAFVERNWSFTTLDNASTAW